jgi:hypothetical protein
MGRPQPKATPWFLVTMAGVAIGLFPGCGSGRPPLAPVYGVVTLDGKPLADAEVVFTCEGGRHSTARTDAKGRYELQYLPDVPGAVLGRHTVRISRFDPDTLIDSVPPKYNSHSELTAEVTKGSNEINFRLTSK